MSDTGLSSSWLIAAAALTSVAATAPATAATATAVAAATKADSFAPSSNLVRFAAAETLCGSPRRKRAKAIDPASAGGGSDDPH